MKVLSDNTADKLSRLLADGGGLQQPRRVRGASTTPPAPMWQIHVVPSTGVVTVDGGDVYHGLTRHEIADASVGTATGACLVVWEYDSNGGTISLMGSVTSLTSPFRVLGAIKMDGSTYYSEQYFQDPIEIDSVYAGPDASGDAVAKTLGGADYNAATDSWAWGDTDQTTGKPTYPIYNPTRLYWQDSAHTLWMFRRTETFNSSGMLVSVSTEVRTAVFVTVAEMP